MKEKMMTKSNTAVSLVGWMKVILLFSSLSSISLAFAFHSQPVVLFPCRTVPPSSGLGRRPSLQIARRSMVINGDAQKRKEQAIQLEKVQKENQRLFSTLQKKLGALEKKIVQQQARQQTQQPRRSSYNQNRERQPLQPAAPAMFQESDARAKVANLKRRLQEKEVDLLRRRVQKLTLLAQEWQLQLLDNALATHDELNLQKSALITQSLEKLHKQLLSVQIQRANQTKPN